ncbi:MAG: PTS sugar transporter subunit IIA [Erysipelotrichaceae bacterium]|nr:PTS sugar transporter subunit IIA [Erysipelotrichaceae bacterium]
MDPKYRKLLYTLSKAETAVTASFLADRLGVSSRSIKTYIKDLNSSYSELIRSGPDGYLINREIYEKLVFERDEIPQDQEERIRYIINYLVEMEQDEELDINELADSIYVSSITIRRDLKIAKELCEHYRIELKIANDSIRLIGKEKDKRALINSIYTKEFEQNDFDLYKLQEFFPDYDLTRIKSITIEKCKEFNYLINGYTIDQIVLDIVIGIDRIRHSFTSEDNGEMSNFNLHELELARAITGEFEKVYDIRYSNEELQAFTIILFTHLLKIDYQSITAEDLKHIIGEDVYRLAEEIIEETDDYFIRNQNEEFFTRFALHLKNLLLRAKSNYINQNSLTETIKTSCPLLFDCAVNISNKIYEKTGYQINDDEIAYICIHIGSLLETSDNQKLSLGLVMPKYYNFSDEIRNKIQDRLAAEAVIKVIPEEDFQQFNTLDLIITTNPNLKIDAEKKVLITGIIRNSELDAIEQKVRQIRQKKKIETVINQLLSVTSDKFFYKNPDFSNKEELITGMVNDLLDKGIVGYDFLNDVFHRENISSTAFNQIAVPHTLTMNANQTMISIALFDKPFSWGGKKISIVFMFAIHPEDRKMFHFIFDNLISLLLNDENVRLLKECSSYAEFIEKIPYIKE